MDDIHVEFAKAAYRPAIARDVGIGQFVEERPVIDRIARKKRLRRLLEKAKRPRRMARQVENRKMPVSKIDDVAFLETPRRMSGGDAVVVGRVAFMRQGIDEKAIALVQPVAREAGTDFRRKALR